MEKTVARAYYRALLSSLAGVGLVWLALRFVVAAPAGTLALVAMGALILKTPFLVRMSASREHAAARLLAGASTILGICLGTASATENGLFLFAGFMLGIGYGVYALMKNIDDHVAPSRILITTMVQAALAFYLASS
jgi:hypothetical protein